MYDTGNFSKFHHNNFIFRFGLHIAIRRSFLALRVPQNARIKLASCQHRNGKPPAP